MKIFNHGWFSHFAYQDGWLRLLNSTNLSFNPDQYSIIFSTRRFAKGLIFCSLILLGLVSSCNKKNLEQPALGQLDESILANKQGVEGLLIGAYSLLDGISIDANGSAGGWGSAASNWIYGSVCGSQAYTGSGESDQPPIRDIEKFNAPALDYNFEDKWVAVYAGVQRANTVLRVMAKAKDINEGDRKLISAQARFLRGFYHFEAIKIWHHVPFVDESITYEAANYHLANDTIIWPAIEDDLKYAVENLVPVMSAIGRVNKYSAEAFLAKAYIFQAYDKPEKYAAAKILLDDIINNGVNSLGYKYRLVKYADNFNAATKNSPESVFSVQMSVNDGAEGNNGNVGEDLNFTYTGGPGGCCGFFQPSQYLVNHFKTNPVTGLPDLDHFNDTDVTSDEGLQSTDPFTPYAGTLDPRLDWTVGRRGIPYLDWGIHPGQQWIRDQAFSGPYSPIKNVYYQSQAGIYSYSGGWPMLTANNVSLIRFSDVLLWAAETEIELGNLEKARDYVNLVRSRAADSTGWVKLPDGKLAANYKVGLYLDTWANKDFARKAVRFERAIELGMEGHRFFDLVRWGVADLEINKYLEKEKNLRPYLKNATFIKGVNEYFPLPQKEIDLSAGPDGIRKLKQNPGY